MCAPNGPHILVLARRINYIPLRTISILINIKKCTYLIYLSPREISTLAFWGLCHCLNEGTNNSTRICPSFPTLLHLHWSWLLNPESVPLKLAVTSSRAEMRKGRGLNQRRTIRVLISISPIWMWIAKLMPMGIITGKYLRCAVSLSPHFEGRLWST